MRDVIPQNIKDALQDLPEGLQQQVLEYLQSLDHAPQPAARGRGWPRLDVSTLVGELRDVREGHDPDFE